METFTFVPANVFKDTAAFSDPGTEAETRSQLSTPHEQTRDYINEKVVPAVNTMQQDIEALKSAVGDPEAIQRIIDAIDEIQDFLDVTGTIAYVE